MGRLPDIYRDRQNKDRKITLRTPYVMSSSTIMRSNEPGIQFPSAGFLHSQDRPFEVHRLIPVVTTVPVGDLTQISGVADGRFISCRILNFGKDQQDLLKASTPLVSLIKSQTERVWEWTEPRTLEKTEGFTVTLDSSVFDDSELLFRVTFSFEGYLLTLAADRS